MTKQQKTAFESEELVRRILTQVFRQNPSERQIREVAKKVREKLPQTQEQTEAA